MPNYQIEFPILAAMEERKVFFRQLNEFFDHVYVISLKRAVDRQAHVKEELDGLEYELFWGKDKREFDLRQLEKEGIYNEQLAIRHHRFSKPMPGGMLGCSWSHKLIYEDVLKKGYQKVLIMEDDIVINDEAVAVFPSILNELPKDWELFYLGYHENEEVPDNGRSKQTLYHLLRFLRLIKFSHKTINNLFPERVSEHVWKAGYHDCTHAYAITPSAAKTLMELQTPVSYFPDNLLAHAITNEMVRGYIVKPQLINQQFQVSAAPTHSYIKD